jgi:hypothetical protein
MRISNFTGVIVASAIATSAIFATPVAAASDGDRLARIVLGAAVVGLVAHKIHKNKKHRKEVSRDYRYDDRDYRPQHRDYRPKRCLRKKYTRHGWKTFYSQRCLAKHRAHRNDYYDNRRQDRYRDSRRQYDDRRKLNDNYFRKWNDSHS